MYIENELLDNLAKLHLDDFVSLETGLSDGQSIDRVHRAGKKKRKRRRWMQTQPRSDSREEMREHMSSLEVKTRPDGSEIALQPEYRWKSRYNLVVLLSKSQNDLALGADTLFLAVNILDRYSLKRIVKRCHCKLLGGVALLLASKYLNRLSTASSFRERCCLFSGYELQDITQMEKMVLLTLDYLVGFPAIIGFMQIELLGFQQSKPLYDMVLYICELTLCYSEFVSKPAALVAKAAVETARRLIGRPLGQGEPSMDTGDEVRRLLPRISKILSKPPRGLFYKYAREDRSRVALAIGGHQPECGSTYKRYQKACSLVW